MKHTPEYYKEYAMVNKDRLLAYRQEYYLANREAMLKKNKEYRLKNAEVLKESKKIKYQANKEAERIKRTEYRESNKGLIAFQKKTYHEKNRERDLKRSRDHYLENSTAYQDRARRYYEENKEKHAEQGRAWAAANIEKVREMSRKTNRKIRSTPKGNLSSTVSKRMNESLRKGMKAGRHWESLVGYTIDQLMRHIESLFRPGMTWENYGKVWHIDHKIPIAVFNFERPDEVEFKICWSLKNLQPLGAKENMSKGAKLEMPLHVMVEAQKGAL